MAEHNNKIQTDEVHDWLANISHDEDLIKEIGAQRNLLLGQLRARGIGATGKLKIEVDIKLGEDDPALFEYDPSVSINIPKKKTRGSWMYQGEDGHHSRDDPKQYKLPFRPEEKSTTRIILESDDETKIHSEDE